MCWLSVIIPTYNGEHYLPRALDGIVAQKTSDLEVIAVDDGSTDNTLSILSSYSDRLPVKILKNVVNQGWVQSTNNGLASAKGKYITFLHQDDCWLSSRLEVLKNRTTEFPQANLLLHPVYFIDRSNKILGRWHCPFSSAGALLEAEFLLRRLLVQNFICIAAPIFKRSAADAVSRLDPELWFTADWKYWLSLAELGSWHYIPEPLSCFRIHSESQTLTGGGIEPDYWQQHRVVLDAYKNFLGTHSSTKTLAWFSARTNTTLAKLFRRGELPDARYFIEALKLGPIGWWNYLYLSRIHERVWTRLKLGKV